MASIAIILMSFCSSSAIIIAVLLVIILSSRPKLPGSGGSSSSECPNVNYTIQQDLGIVGTVLKTLPADDLNKCKCDCNNNTLCTHFEVHTDGGTKKSTCVLKNAFDIPQECAKQTKRCNDWIEKQDWHKVTGYYHPDRGWNDSSKHINEKLQSLYKEIFCRTSWCQFQFVISILSNIGFVPSPATVSTLASMGVRAVNAVGKTANLSALASLPIEQQRASLFAHRYFKDNRAVPYQNLDTELQQALEDCANDGAMTSHGATRSCNSKRKDNCKKARDWKDQGVLQYNGGGFVDNPYRYGGTNCF
jgi:hypothetical protein